MKQDFKVLSENETLNTQSMEELKGGHIVIIESCKGFTISSQKLQ